MDGTSQAIFWRDADRRCDLSVGSAPRCPRPTSMVNPSYRDRDIPGRDAGYRRESFGTHASLQRDWHRASDLGRISHDWRFQWKPQHLVSDFARHHRYPRRTLKTSDTIQFEKVANLSELEQAFNESKSSKKAVILDFYADWCTDCVRMENTTFRDASVVASLTDYRLLKVDVTDPDDHGTGQIKKRFGVFGPPAMLFFGTDGTEHRDKRIYGFLSAPQFVDLIKTLP